MIAGVGGSAPLEGVAAGCGYWALAATNAS